MEIISTVPKVLFSKTTDLYTAYLFSEYAQRLKHHQLRIRIEIFISLEITLNAFNV